MSRAKFEKRYRLELREPGRDLRLAAALAFSGCAATALLLRAQFVALLFAVPALAIASAWLRHRAVIADARMELVRQGKDTLVVLTDSTVWKDRIERGWGARLGDRALLLNRSTVGAHPLLPAWRHLTLGRNRTPVVIHFPPDRPPALYRFYPAFLRAKHGDTTALEELERRMFADLERQ